MPHPDSELPLDQAAPAVELRGDPVTGENAGSRRRFPIILALIAILIWGLDQGSKQLIQNALSDGSQIHIIGDFFRFFLVYNPGAAFSMGVNYTWVLSLIATAVIVGIVLVSRRLGSWLWTIGLALILGGALGNLTDRLLRAPGFGLGHVVDFVSIGNFAIFNVADSAVCTGAGFLILASFRGIPVTGQTDSNRVTGASPSPKNAEPDAVLTELSEDTKSSQPTKNKDAR